MKKRKKRAKKGGPQTITKAVTHIRLEATSAGKLTALDQLATVYLALTQQYTTLFCTDELPKGYRAPCFLTPLSERWHRVAIQQAAGIAQSWRSNRANAYQDHLDTLSEYREHETDRTLEDQAKEPEWNVPTLRQLCIQANSNAIELEEAKESTFDYWLKLSTLDKGHLLLVPLLLADYHKEQLTDPKTGKRRTLNSSVTLNKRGETWWLTFTYDETVAVQAAPDALVIGTDMGIANFVTTSDGKQYGTFNGTLRERQKRDRENRRRKVKLRKCLEKKGVAQEKLPSKSSAIGQRLSRHVRQEVNRAVNLCFEEHEATRVKSAYSSQECHVCHYVDRKNRPRQQTFCCRVCGHTAHADKNAAENIASRLGDLELLTCQNRQEVNRLLMRRHGQRKQKFRHSVVVPPAQLGLWACSQASTDVG